MRIYAVKAPYRIETPQFSMSAVFEAVVNAVAHRDPDSTAPWLTQRRNPEVIG
jgi:predicted HTH transcriptional regulator